MLNLQNLPLEIRLLIYEHTLIDIPRWNKHHNPRCKHHPPPGDLERPPFLSIYMTICPENKTIQTSPFCSCAKRTGLSLLQTTRSINAEASPVFWSKNTFCLLDGRDLTVAVGHILRRETAQRIKRISIMNPDRRGFTEHIRGGLRVRGARRAEFWDAVLQCTRLESLEIPLSYIKGKGMGRIVRELVEKVVGLRGLELTRLVPYCWKDTVCGYPFPSSNFMSFPAVYVRCSRRMLLGDYVGDEAIASTCREIESNFYVHVDSVVKTQYLGAEEHRMEAWRDMIKLAPGLHSHENTRTIKLPAGETTLITFYGLPVQ
ncbi:hypothetical protein VFPPC_18771 [Pochonia chlamydosporia 170]|uniref:DUF7730 domain-containing protein n=1 Tax=Pochonia chlamydosporia 170 TaxID=1380566 RepID=A0A219AS85_METCM|nr:hypothetical protein VFPPC_18771 [Pochonia chlamydosporia 170]OWT43502.1 hypothetical protein VFPPC_18771 [Pochonia chlamydosporia 170]